jgi:hypothetical protein
MYGFAQPALINARARRGAAITVAANAAATGGAPRPTSPVNVSQLVLAPARDRRLHGAVCRFSV